MGFSTFSFTREDIGLIITAYLYAFALYPMSALSLIWLPFFPLGYNIYGIAWGFFGEYNWPYLFLLFPALFLTIPFCFLAIPVGVFLFALSPLLFSIVSFLIPVANILTSITWIVIAFINWKKIEKGKNQKLNKN